MACAAGLVNCNGVWNFGTADFSISMWIQTSPRYETQWILTKRAYCSHAPFWNVGITWDGRLIFEMDQDYDGTNYGNINGTTNVLDNAWHHIAFVRQNTAMRIYVDGTSTPAASATASPT